MKLSAVVVLVLLFTLCANMNAQKTFTVDYRGTLPDMPTSFYAFSSTGGVETVVMYTFNETIKSCTISTTSNPSCLLREGKPGVVGSTDGSNSLLNSPISIQSNLFADMGNHKIRKYGYNEASTLAGSGAKGFVDGPAASAQFNSPIGVVDYLTDVYVADAANLRIRKISDGKVSTIAGTGEMGFSGDSGPALNAKISYPYAIAANLAGVYFVDVSNFRIRKIDHSSGIISTVAGNGVKGTTGDNGLATAASIDAYTSLVANSNYDIYFLDITGSSIRAVLPDGKIYTVATIPKLALISMYGESTMFAVTTDKQVYMVKSQSTCKASESYIGGKCVPVCYGASLDAACGGPSRGSCDSGFSCKCQKGFSGSQCEITDKTVNSNGSKIGFCVYGLIVLMVSYLMLWC